MNQKRGDYPYYVIISLILGVIILGIVLYFLFNEYFTGTDEREICRTSIVLRANSPEVKNYGFNFFTLRDKFPLKCRTEVVNIDKDNFADINKIIAETMVSCWDLYGRGDYTLFPSGTMGLDSYCTPCARIHLSEEAKELLRNSTIPIASYMESNKFKEVSYYKFLTESGTQFSAFDMAYGRPFNLYGDKFIVNSDDQKEGVLRNKRNSKTESGAVFSNINLPGNFYSDRGDLLIFYGSIASPNSEGIGDTIPYLFYFQEKQGIDPWNELNKEVIDASFWTKIKTADVLQRYSVSMCQRWDGIPA